MTSALQQLRRKLPSEGDNPESRARIADAMIASAIAGKHSQTDFFNAGMSVVMKSRSVDRLGLG